MYFIEYMKNLIPKNLLKGLIIVIGTVIFGGVGYFFVKTANDSSQVMPQEEVSKNNVATTTEDASSLYLKEEIARKKQRDTDRNKCIADAERQYAEFTVQNPGCAGPGVLGARCLSIIPRVQENIDRCYFRFPNN